MVASSQLVNTFACIISIIMVGCILIKEVIRRCKASAKRTETSKLESYLNKFSFITILICFVKAFTLLSFQIPGLCEYINPKTDIPIMAIRISFTFYQITTFIYCFTIPNKCKYNLIIITAYLIGFLILFSSVISRGFFVDIKPKGIYGCDFIPGQPTVGAATFAIYYIWDLSVLCVYIKKLRTLNKIQQNADETIKDTDKMRKFLSKMVFLTALMEIISFMCVPMATFLLSAVFAEQAYFLWYIFWNLEIISTCFIQYLMIRSVGSMHSEKAEQTPTNEQDAPSPIDNNTPERKNKSTYYDGPDLIVITPFNMSTI